MKQSRHMLTGNLISYSIWRYVMTLLRILVLNGKQGVANRGLANDPETVAEADRKTAVQKVIILERMLAVIAQFAPSLLWNEILKRSTSLACIWQRIRRHYGFNQSEMNVLYVK